MNKLKSFRWPAVLLLTAAASFYSGHYWGAVQATRQHYAVWASNTCILFDLLKTGKTEEALDVQTKFLSLQVECMNKNYQPSSPVAMFTNLPIDFRPSAMRNVESLRQNHPDVTLTPEALAYLNKFKNPLVGASEPK